MILHLKEKSCQLRSWARDCIDQVVYLQQNGFPKEDSGKPFSTYFLVLGQSKKAMDEQIWYMKIIYCYKNSSLTVTLLCLLEDLSNSSWNAEWTKTEVMTIVFNYAVPRALPSSSIQSDHSNPMRFSHFDFKDHCSSLCLFTSEGGTFLIFLFLDS